MTAFTAIPAERSVQAKRLAPGLVLRGAVAIVWVIHGLVNKLLHYSPRHLAIVQSMPGLHGTTGAIAVNAIGIGEILIAAWILSGIRPKSCATFQTVILLTMNVLELIFARNYLLWPAGLIPLNLLFLATAWVAAEMSGTEPFYWLKRHPFAVKAFFEHSLVLTYAFPRELLEPMLPPGVELDTYRGYGLLAIAVVQTRNLRPSIFPSGLGKDFVLSGYRIFTKLKADGRTRRGLRILRSDADSALMVRLGNLLTHYQYRHCRAAVSRRGDQLIVDIRTSDGQADFRAVARLDASDPQLPAGSIFETHQDARRFAGPLPYTFDYERATDSIIVIKGQRQDWAPRLVPVEVKELGYFHRPTFAGNPGILSSAFYVHDIEYKWEPGIRVPLSPAIRSPFQGVAQIVRFNWPQYVIGTVAIAAAMAFNTQFHLPTLLRTAVMIGVAGAFYFIAASLIASFWIYDCSRLEKWRWIADELTEPPRSWINLHCGLDESTPTLRRLFPSAAGRVFDIFDPGEMTEPSILRARSLAVAATPAETARYDHLPIGGEACDAAFLLMSAHELRHHAARVTLFCELRRALRPGGRIVLAEHLRDTANFMAFGPGFLHFHSRAAWRNAAREADLQIDREFHITPFVRIFILRRPI